VQQEWRISYSLIVDNGNLFDTTIATKLVVKVALLSSDAQSEHPEHVARVRLLLGLNILV